MFNIPTRLKRQAGYIMLEAALALPVAAGIMTYYLAEQRDRLTEDMAKIHGQHMKAVAAATNAYITNNYGLLIAGKDIPIPGSTDNVANPLAPTVAELMALGLLPNSPGLAKPVYGGGFTIRLTTNNPVVGAVNGFVGTTASVAPGGQVSSRTIGRALQEIGFNGMATGLGGFGDDTLRAQNQDVAVPGIDVAVALGPGVAAQPGLMAVKVGTGTCDDGTGLACDVFLRRDGTRHMTGDLKMGSDDNHNQPDPTNGIIGNNSISHVNLIRAARIHIEESPKCQDTHATNENQHCGGAIKTGFLKSTGNVDVHGNLYLGNPVTNTQFRFGEIKDTVEIKTNTTCPTNYVVVGIKKCQVPPNQYTGSGDVGEDGGAFSVYNKYEITVECTAVCGRIVPDEVDDNPPVVTR